MNNQALGSAAGRLSLVQESFGFRGGGASSTLDVGNPGGGALSVSALAEAGIRAYHGMVGDAFASAVGTDRSGKDLHVRAEAVTMSSTQPASTGVATLGRVFGESTNGGDVWVTGVLRQGLSDEPGGTTNVLLDNHVDGATRGALTLEQFAFVGSLETPDPASRSESTLSKTAEIESLRLFAWASGGESEATAVAVNRTGDAHASALAFAGTGFDATTRARAETAEDRSKVTVGVNPLPGFPSVNRAGAHAGNGASYLGIASGSASSFSEGIHRGDGTVEVRDFAVAGDGFGVNAGDAHSTAVAVGSGRSLVEALSDATAGGGRAGGNPGRATANATARSLGAVAAHAIVRSGSGDTLGSGVARASSTGLSGEVAVSAFGAFSMRAASTVLGNAQAEAYLTETDLIVTNAVDAYAVSLVNAGHRELAPFLQAGSRAETAVTNMDEVLGLGRFGSHHNQDGAITFSGHLASKRPLVLPIPFPQPPREEGSYVLALLGLSVIEEGFDGLRFQVQIDGTTIIDISFADVVGAAAFFDDKVFTFAGANGLLPDLDVLLDVTSSSETFAMELEFILGTVPERSTFVLLVLTLAVRPAYRGSRGC